MPDASFKPRDCYNPLGFPKIKYTTKADAKRAIKSLGGGFNGVTFKKNPKPYKCPYCHHYHIGHSSANDKV